MLEYLSNNVAGLKAGNLLKRDPTQVFSSEYCEIFENIFFYRTPSVAVFVSLMKQLFSIGHLMPIFSS